MLIAERCPLCGCPGPAPCAPCRATLRHVGAYEPPEGVDAAVALVEYSGAGRRLVTTLKYANHRSMVAWMGRAMAVAAAATWGVPPRDLVVTWVPASRVHRRRRGFDQAELVARSVARSLGRPSRALLVRPSGPSQTGRSRLERLEGPTLTNNRARLEVPVIVVDDVCTTGATLRVAAQCLRRAGATEIASLVIARTSTDRDRPGREVPQVEGLTSRKK